MKDLVHKSSQSPANQIMYRRTTFSLLQGPCRKEGVRNEGSEDEDVEERQWDETVHE